MHGARQSITIKRPKRKSCSLSSSPRAFIVRYVRTDSGSEVAEWIASSSGNIDAQVIPSCGKNTQTELDQHNKLHTDLDVLANDIITRRANPSAYSTKSYGRTCKSWSPTSNSISHRKPRRCSTESTLPNISQQTR